ncbi:MAG TPA: acyltransferase family protein [Noviherbaspirillum sp.]
MNTFSGQTTGHSAAFVEGGIASPRLSASAARPAYRPDIDGLRAIAVLAVIAFHANPSLLPGGFAGVDVFFVLSGYLITGLIFEALENGSFSYADFYARRIRRIFPAYIAVAVATLLVSSYMLIPNDYIFYTTSLAASWAFLSNVFFSMLSWGYFGQRTEEFPLLHTWSLSVEEQFYFIFPVLLVFLYRHWRQHVVPVLVICCAVFLAISEYKTGEIKSYFLISSRAHELIIGALSFFLVRRYPVRDHRIAGALGAMGFLLVAGAFLFIHKDLPFPGINSLFPCIGAALLIVAGSSGKVPLPLLQSRPLVSVGLISYSLYLWHWPIFSFLKYRHIALTPAVLLGAVALSFFLSWCTWRFIENPVRRNTRLGFRQVILPFYLLPAGVFMSIGLYSYLTEGAPRRFSEEMRDLISSYSFERDLTRACSVRAEDYKEITLEYLLEHCSFGHTGEGKARVLLMGDSHAHHFKPFVDQLARQAGMRAVYHVQGGCFPTELQVTDRNPSLGPTTCQQRNADLLKLVGHFDYVLLAGFWASEPERDLEKELSHVVDEIVRAGATPVIFKDNPFHEPDLSRCILYRKRGWIDASANCSIPYKYVEETQAYYDAIVERMRERHPQTVIIDPKHVMCGKDECATHIANIALYKDANHINAKAAELLGGLYLDRVGNPLTGTPALRRFLEK